MTPPAEPFLHPALLYQGDTEYLAGIVPFVLEGLLAGEPIWPGRSSFEYPACVQHEALINHAFAGRDVTVLCPYDVGALGRTALVVRVPQVGVRSRRVVDNLPLPAPAGAAVFRFDLGGLADARVFTRLHAERSGLRVERLLDLVFAAAELCANSVIHGGGRGVVRLWRHRELVVCEVLDDGVLDDPLAGRRLVSPGQLGGWGLLLVNQLADLVRLHRRPGGTTTRAFFRVEGG